RGLEQPHPILLAPQGTACKGMRQTWPRRSALALGGKPMTSKRLRAPLTRRGMLQAGAGLAGILAAGRAPAFAQAPPKKLLWAHIVPPPESGAVAFEWMAKEFNERTKGALAMELHGGTLISKELEIMNAVKTGNVAIGGPAGAAATVFPEMGVFLVPY